MMEAMKDKGDAHGNTRPRGLTRSVAIPAVNGYPSRKEWEEACWKNILRSPEWLNLLTVYERRNIVMRVAVTHRLNEQKSYRDIGRELWLSPQTISAIKKGIGEERYRSYADRGKTERKKRVYGDHRPPRPSPRIGIPRKTKYGTIYL